MQFSEKLCDLRRREGLSQEQLADRLGVTRQSVSKWESGTAMPELTKLIALSELFGVSVDYLVKDHLLKSEQAQNQTTARLEEKLEDLSRRVDKTIFHYTSKTRVLGLPLVSVRFSHERHPCASSTAVGIVAVGNFAVGIISIGLISLGLLSLGMLSFGLLALGAVSMGVLAVGMTALGVFAFGLSAMGAHLAVGTAATGNVAIGANVSGSAVLRIDGAVSLEEVRRFLETHAARLWGPVKDLIFFFLRLFC